ncbi:MAG: M24 family metallopeptidase [Candidatus Hermodarchaeota archaeon]
MRTITHEKFGVLLKFLEENQIDVLMIYDFENARNVNLQYISGHPTDAILLITQNGESILFPGDYQLANELADVDEIIDISNFNFSFHLALKELLDNRWKKSSIKFGVHETIPYGTIIKMKKNIPQIKIFKDPIQITTLFQELRSTKSDFEITQLKKAADIGNKTIKDIRNFCETATNNTEKDLSFLVQKKIGEYGADDIAFESLVANTTRSHALHCHPYATNQRFALQGLALIDFGAKYKGYCSDITVPIGFKKLSEEQQKMRDLVIKSYETAIEIIDIGVPFWKIHNEADQVLKAEGYSLPYALGHGLGLTVHDAPIIGRKPSDEYSLKHWKEELIQDGMVFTIEPGVYKQGLGGVRLENDVLVENGRVEIITKSGFIQI